MSQRTFLLLLGALIALRAATLPILPLLDPSEARYALVARDMLEGGDFVTPMIWANGEHIPFFSKPPMLFWLQAASMRALDTPELATRLPPFVAALAMLAATWALLRRHLAADVLRGALLILLSTPLFFFTAGLGLTDMLLCLAVGGALFSHLAFTREEDARRARRLSLLTFAFLGLGMITKGPIAVVQFGLPVLLWSAWNRRLGDFGRQAWWPGLLIFAIAWVPWFALTERANPGFLEYFFVNENFLRFVSPSYGDRYGGGHKFPPGMAVVFFVLACLPWLAVLAWRVRDRAARGRALDRLRSEDLQLLLFTVVANVVFLSFSRHILGTYVLPVLPAAAVLLAAVLASIGFGLDRQARVATILVVVYSLAIPAGLPLVRGRWSTQRIIERAISFQRERGAHGRLVFVDKRPFSARFYGMPSLEFDYIPWDAGNEHYWWYLEPKEGHLLVLRREHPAKLAPYVTDRLRLVEQVGRYSLWEPVAPDARTAGPLSRGAAPDPPTAGPARRADSDDPPTAGPATAEESGSHARPAR